jgi:hypothetical protein
MLRLMLPLLVKSFPTKTVEPCWMVTVVPLWTTRFQPNGWPDVSVSD